MRRRILVDDSPVATGWAVEPRTVAATLDPVTGRITDSLAAYCGRASGATLERAVASSQAWRGIVASLKSSSPALVNVFALSVEDVIAMMLAVHSLDAQDPFVGVRVAHAVDTLEQLVIDACGAQPRAMIDTWRDGLVADRRW